MLMYHWELRTTSPAIPELRHSGLTHPVTQCFGGKETTPGQGSASTAPPLMSRDHDSEGYCGFTLCGELGDEGVCRAPTRADS